MTARLFTLILALCLPALAQAWWNSDWQYRKEINIDPAALGQGAANNAAEVLVPVRLHTGNFGYFADLAPEGADLRFVAADDKTALKFHIEKFDPVNEMALLWVKVPSVPGAGNSNKIYMYYGNKAAPQGGDAAATYDINQMLVYHFAAQGTPQDSTGFANHADTFTGQSASASLIGGGARFDGHQALRVGPKPTLRFNPETGLTYSAWFKFDVPQPNAHLMQWLDGGNGVAIVAHNGNVKGRLTVNGKAIETAAVAASAGTWHLVALTVSADKAALYLDGHEAATVEGKLPAFGGSLSVGAALDGSYGFIGEMDEVGVAKTVRAGAWLNAAAAAQGPSSTLLVYGEDQDANAEAGGSKSYFRVILQSVTLDGWVVIVLLVIMAAVSWVVMIGKGLYLSRVVKDNLAFMTEFKKLGGGDPRALDADEGEEDEALGTSPITQALLGKHDHFQSSTLYRIYHQGIRELNQRVGTAVGAQAAGLSEQSVNAIRAAVDAAVVRESQRLNAQMVLLTLAISGGPFLGLLGTVVGVMITFAAIAATGDVNINAIAPGIAAALVATVAGLAVAIPALFAYNYLGSRIRDLTADMRVFVDELVTRLAEHYAR
jgi:biopolymer transport protein ExbB